MRFRHQGLEGQFLEFVAHALHAHPAAEGGVDVECLLRDPPPLGDRNEMQGPHIVQPVGELDQQHSDVVRDGEEQFAQVLGLGGLFRHEVEPLDLGQALDEAADLVAEKLIDFFARVASVSSIVSCRTAATIVASSSFRSVRMARDFERMGEIRISGGALLCAVRLHGIDVGTVQEIFVRVRIVAPDAVDQFVLAKDLRRPRAARSCDGERHAWIIGSRDLRRKTEHVGCSRKPYARHRSRPLLRGPVAHCGYSPSSSVSAGGTKPSRPRNKSSSVMRSNCTSAPNVRVDGHLACRRHGGNGFGLRLVDFDVLLQRMDQVFLHVLGREPLVGDLAQSHDGVLVVVPVDGDRGAGRDETSPMTGQQDQFEPVLDLVDAIFDGNARHTVDPIRNWNWLGR